MRGSFLFLIIAPLLALVAPANGQGQANSRSAQSAAADRFDIAIAEAKATMLVDPNLTLTKAAIAGEYAKHVGNEKQIAVAVATVNWLEGEAYIRLDDMNRAAPLIINAKKRAIKLANKSKLLGDILLSSAEINNSQANVTEALADYQDAHAVFLAIGDTRSRAKTLLSLAGLYSDANDNVSALKYLGQAIDVYQGDPDIAIAAYNHRGGILQGLGRLAESDAEFRKALRIERQLKSPLLRARILGNIARGRLMAGDLDAADRDISEGSALAANGEASSWRPQLSAIAAQSALQHHDPARAAVLIAQAFAGVDLSATTPADREAHKTAYETYRALGQTGKALVHLAALKRLDDEATKLATTTNAALMAARFDSANQELKITKLRQERLIRDAQIAAQQARLERMVFAGAAAATTLIIAMLAVALFTIRRSRNETRAANADLAITNAALSKALAAKTEFLATTSHEIRTPLNGILGMTQVMLADANLGDRIRERIMLVHGAGITMRALVDDILDVAKMETGNMTIETAPFDLRATLTDAARLWEEQATGKGVGFALDLAGCPVMVEGDAARVRQIVFNLLSNAVKFTAEGSVTLRCHASDDDSPVSIAVTDTGVGIPSAKLEEIFEAFRQADAGTTRHFGGTGLGLAICRNLARAMGGDVAVESRPGEGSTFRVDLPLSRIASPEADEGADAGGGGALLVVDRNPITRAMFRSLLAPHIARIEFATSTDDAVALLGTGRIAGVLIDDATMRGGGDVGPALRLIVQAARAAGADTALLWPVTAESERGELLATGVDRVIAKPVSGDALVAAILPLGRAEWSEPSLVTQAA